MFKKTTSSLHSGGQEPGAGSAPRSAYRHVYAGAPKLTEKTFVWIGSGLSVVGIAFAAVVISSEPDPLTTTWGYPALLLGAVVTIAGALLIARGVAKESLLNEDVTG